MDQPSPTSQQQQQQQQADADVQTQTEKSKLKKFSLASLKLKGKPKSTASTSQTMTTATATTSASPVRLGQLRVPPESDPETTSNGRKHSALSSPIVIRRSNPGMIGKAKLNTIKITMTLVGVFLACWTPYYVLCIW